MYQTGTSRKGDLYFYMYGGRMGEHYDAKLALALAEHGLLKSLGWRWTVWNRDYTAHFAWIAPLDHKGSQRVYFSRSHAINSVKKHTLGFDRDSYSSEV